MPVHRRTARSALEFGLADSVVDEAGTETDRRSNGQAKDGVILPQSSRKSGAGSADTTRTLAARRRPTRGRARSGDALTRIGKRQPPATIRFLAPGTPTPGQRRARPKTPSS